MCKTCVKFVEQNAKDSEKSSLARAIGGRTVRRAEKRLEKRVKRVFVNQLDFVFRQVRKMKDILFVSEFVKILKEESEVSPEQKLRIDFISDNIPSQSKLVDEIVDADQIMLTKGANHEIRALKLASFGISFSLKNVLAEKFLENKKTLELSDYRGNIHGTTKKRIKNILLNGVRAGKSWEQMGEEIQKQGDEGVFSKSRAELIAIREIGDAYEFGRQVPVSDFYDEFPDREIKKRTITAGDRRVTRPHRINASDGWIFFKQPFSGTGDDRAPFTDNPRCRCSTVYKILGENTR